jgi:hypothetical protein
MYQGLAAKNIKALRVNECIKTQCPSFLIVEHSHEYTNGVVKGKHKGIKGK